MIEQIIHWEPNITKRNLKLYNIRHDTNYTLEELNILTYDNNIHGKMVYCCGYPILKQNDIKSIINTCPIIYEYTKLLKKIRNMLYMSKFYKNKIDNSTIIRFEVNDLTWGYFGLRTRQIFIVESIAKISAHPLIIIDNILKYFIPNRSITVNDFYPSCLFVNGGYSINIQITKEEVEQLILNNYDK